MKKAGFAILKACVEMCTGFAAIVVTVFVVRAVIALVAWAWNLGR